MTEPIPSAVAVRRENRDVAVLLRQGAELLAGQGANPFRVQAYRAGARRLEQLAEPVGEILARGGRRRLEELPDIGAGIATAVEQIVRTGRWSLLERLRGSASPEALFETLPGVGPELARRIHEELHVDSLEALEMAAHDGRLARVRGFGPRRVEGLRASLESRLGRGGRAGRARERERPAVPLLLDVDREYRRRAAADELPTVAPRRFNPAGAAWLPILHTDRRGWHLTALFSNTALAHRLGRTRDWVVVYFYDRDHQEGQATVVTERRGTLAGQRVVRGREAECEAYYAGRRHGARHADEG